MTPPSGIAAQAIAPIAGVSGIAPSSGSTARGTEEFGAALRDAVAQGAAGGTTATPPAVRSGRLKPEGHSADDDRSDAHSASTSTAGLAVDASLTPSATAHLPLGPLAAHGPSGEATAATSGPSASLLAGRESGIASALAGGLPASGTPTTAPTISTTVYQTVQAPRSGGAMVSATAGPTVASAIPVAAGASGLTGATDPSATAATAPGVPDTATGASADSASSESDAAPLGLQTQPGALPTSASALNALPQATSFGSTTSGEGPSPRAGRIARVSALPSAVSSLAGALPSGAGAGALAGTGASQAASVAADLADSSGAASATSALAQAGARGKSSRPGDDDDSTPVTGGPSLVAASTSATSASSQTASAVAGAAAAQSTTPTATPASAAAASAASVAVPLQQQLAQPLIRVATSEAGEHTLVVRIAPDDLGPVTVQAHVSDAGVHIELFAPTDAGRDAIRQILPELRSDLGSAGANGSLNVSDQNAPGTGTRDQTQQGWSASQDGGGSSGAIDSVDSVASAGIPQQNVSSHALDVLA